LIGVEYQGADAAAGDEILQNVQSLVYIARPNQQQAVQIKTAMGREIGIEIMPNVDIDHSAGVILGPAGYRKGDGSHP
jgi:hypothetical protein